MRSGPLRHRVWIQVRRETQDATGSVVWTFADWLQRWASIEPLMGREYFAASQVQSDVTTRIRLRYVEGLTPKMRVRHVRGAESPTIDDFYEIESVLVPNEGRRETVLMCRKMDGEGWRNA